MCGVFCSQENDIWGKKYTKYDPLQLVGICIMLWELHLQSDAGDTSGDISGTKNGVHSLVTDFEKNNRSVTTKSVSHL